MEFDPDFFTKERVTPAAVQFVDVEAVEPLVPPRFSRLPFWSISLAIVAMIPVALMVFIVSLDGSKKLLIWPAYVAGLVVFASSLAALVAYCANPHYTGRKVRGLAIAGMLVNLAGIVFVDIGGFAAIGIVAHRAQQVQRISSPAASQPRPVSKRSRVRSSPRNEECGSELQ